MRATLRLTHAALPGMVERGRGAVINVSSVAGWTSLGTYAAAKSWVTVFTESLGAELSGTGVSATAVCPGLTHTEFHDRAQMNVSALPSWAWLDARRVAREGLARPGQGARSSVPSKRYTALALAARYTPRPFMRQVGRPMPATASHGHMTEDVTGTPPSRGRSVTHPLVARMHPIGGSIFGEMSALASAVGAINLGQGFPDTDGPTLVRDARSAGTAQRPRRPVPTRARDPRTARGHRDAPTDWYGLPGTPTPTSW